MSVARVEGCVRASTRLSPLALLRFTIPRLPGTLERDSVRHPRGHPRAALPQREAKYRRSHRAGAKPARRVARGLGLPSEPAEVRSGSPRPGGTPPPPQAPSRRPGRRWRPRASPARRIRSGPAPAPRDGRASGAWARADAVPSRFFLRGLRPRGGRRRSPSSENCRPNPPSRSRSRSWRPTRARPSSRQRRPGTGRDGRRGGSRHLSRCSRPSRPRFLPRPSFRS